ncbi:MAG: M99 family metallo-carboxypeptidase C-terminal domain-containing protein [Syntrophobacteria bacterium]
MTNARKRLVYIPLKRASEIVFRPSSPLVAVVESGESYRVFHGNRRVTRIDPQYFEYDSSIDAITIEVDGDERKVDFGNMVEVAQSFLVVPEKGYRVNVIGFRKPGTHNESGIAIQKDDIKKRFSVDKKGRIYRVEVYREKKFSGMVLVSFSDEREDQIASDSSKVSLLNVSDLSNGPLEKDASVNSEDISHLGR